MQVVAEFLVEVCFDPEEAPFPLTHGDQGVDSSAKPGAAEKSRSAQVVQLVCCCRRQKFLVIVDTQKVAPGVPGVPVSEGIAARGQVETAPPLPHALVLRQVCRDAAAGEIVRLQVVGCSGKS